MAEISAAAVKTLRERTQLPLMDCKKALAETGGDQDAAIQWLREHGRIKQASRLDRETSFGRFGIYVDNDARRSAMVELKCESAPVTKNDDFVQLARDLAEQLATGPGAATAEELLTQPSPSQSGATLGEQKDELFNRVREVFNIGNMIRVEGHCGYYEHLGSVVHGVLVETDGGEPSDLRDVAMHIAAMKPETVNVDQLDPATVEAERNTLSTAARTEAVQSGKPDHVVDKIVEKMVEGRMKTYYAESVLTEQPFVKEPDKTVGALAADKGFKILRFWHWELTG